MFVVARHCVMPVLNKRITYLLTYLYVVKSSLKFFLRKSFITFRVDFEVSI